MSISQAVIGQGWRFANVRQMDETKIGHCVGKNPPKCQMLTGPAGCGKTFTAKEKIRQNPSYARLTASTGIAAVNLGGDTKTIHSELKFYNEASIKKAYERGYLQENLANLALRGYENIALDEISMFSGIHLEYIIEALSDANEYTMKDMGFIGIGDFCQLPPIPDRDSHDPRTGQFAFRSRAWKFFEDNIVKMEKIWRQDNPEFLEVMNLLRAGKGKPAAEILQRLGVKFTPTIDKNYEGTTLMATNAVVDGYNKERLAKIMSPLLISRPIKRGTQLKEWDSQIPLNLYLKEGAYVMILANDVPHFRWVNGDCGWIRGYEKNDDVFLVELVRTGEVVKIKKVKRDNLVDVEPPLSASSSMFQCELDYNTGQWIIGNIEYHPLRLAYASTIHKSQGLSLDRVQINTTERFFGAPAMAYVSFSRARSPENLIVVGSLANVAAKANVSPEVLPWI